MLSVNYIIVFSVALLNNLRTEDSNYLSFARWWSNIISFLSSVEWHIQLLIRICYSLQGKKKNIRVCKSEVQWMQHVLNLKKRSWTFILCDIKSTAKLLSKWDIFKRMWLQTKNRSLQFYSFSLFFPIEFPYKIESTHKMRYWQ